MLHVRHEFPTPDAPFFAANSPGAAIHDSVRPQANEPVVLKRKANSFRDTDLKDRLDALGVNRVVICGAMSQMCIDAAARAAADFGYAVTVVHDACAARPQSFEGVDVPADHVHATVMAALGAFYATVRATENVWTESGR
ncbi:isochorismatase family protein [Roseospira marina]|uniref:isochorismatase family protein n=1 Tax=Roseospira marina TaxID=140057 RepID=UPI001FE39693|nr:isochorismatase family protein [Roseospira marina]